MPVNTTYAGYDLAIEKVTRVRDFAEGEFAVKPKKDVYLPFLGGQTESEYKSYLQRGFIVPAVEPTALAISGAIMRKPAVFEPDSSLNYLIDDVDGNGTALELFTATMVSELLYAGAVGYLVEYTDKNVIKTYNKESIISVTDEYVILSQTYTVPSKQDKYVIETKVEYLELTIESGIYTQNLWREGKKGKGFGIVNSVVPTNRGEPLTEIPFVIANELMADPLLLHLANVNLDQYRMSTDHRHGLHWTALPTLFLFGDLRDEDGNKKQIKVGAGTANHIDDSDARVELLEFTGAGIGSLKAAIDDNIKTMASIGAKMLTGGADVVKAAETARIEASSETATLSIIANIVDDTMQQLLEIIAEWSGATEPAYEVNRDFIDSKLDPQAVLAYLQVLQSGGMSLDSFLNLLVKGELLPKGVTAEDEADRIDTTGTGFNGGEDEETTQV